MTGQICIVIFVARTNEIIVNVLSTRRKLLSILCGTCRKATGQRSSGTWGLLGGDGLLSVAADGPNKPRVFTEENCCLQVLVASVADLLKQVSERL